MARKMLVADLLCGAGGSSTGAERALYQLGLDMELVCLNHWQTAIDTHQINHPKARHYVQDIATVRPHLIVPEGYLDLLMASPTCTHHSVARGGKPTSDQQRSDPWHIITWLTELRVKRLIIENVWEFCGWGPVNPKTGKPIAERKGEYFHAWIDTIKRLGFEPEWRKLNAADYGDATTRQRFILMARSDGRKVSWPMPTHRKRDEAKADLFDDVKPWRPARDIIDWTIKGRSILGRKKPLAPKTLYRIFAGALKFGWPEPFLILLLREIDNSLRYHLNWFYSVRNAPGARAARAKRRAAVRKYVAMLRHFRVAPIDAARGVRADPLLITLRHNGAGSSVDNPIPTLTANGTHVGIAEPVIISPRHGKEGAGPRPRAVGQPLPTITAGGSQMAIAEPIVLSQHTSGAARTVNDPLPTITTGGAGTDERPGCARPMLITVAHGNDPREQDPNGRRAHDIESPLGTIHGNGSAYAVVEPFVLSQASGGSPRGVSSPIPTATTGGNGSSHALISPYYGSGSGETCVSADQPLPTVTSKGRFGMVVPVTQSGGGAQARDVDQPIPTMTTAKGGEFAIVMPVTHSDASDRVRDAGDPLPTITGANRGELAFITAQHGERPGQPPRVHDIEQPTPTIAATGHIDLVEPDFSAAGYDILFRMLEPPELAAAMGFNTAEQKYEFTGTKTEKIKQIGNAVSVAKMKACVGAIMADAAPKRREPAPETYREAAE